MRRFHKYAGSTTAKRVVCIGDSITAGSDGLGGYRTPLFAALTERRQVEFIGSQTTGAGPGKHKGYPNITIALFAPGASAACIVDWPTEFASFGTPHFCLVYLGTNAGRADLMVPDVVDPLLATGVRVVVAPLFSSSIYQSQAVQDATDAFNVALSSAITGHTGYGTTLFYCSAMSSCITAAGDIASDNLHPTTQGYAKMASIWYTFIDQNRLLA